MSNLNSKYDPGCGIISYFYILSLTTFYISTENEGGSVNKVILIEVVDSS